MGKAVHSESEKGESRMRETEIIKRAGGGKSMKDWQRMKVKEQTERERGLMQSESECMGG